MAESFTLACCSVLAWILCSVPGVMSEICSYENDKFGPRLQGFRECRWGCCSKYFDPCCSTPIGLIVGGLIGGIFFLIIVVLLVCCCCCLQRKKVNTGRVIMYPAQSNVAMSSSTNDFHNMQSNEHQSTIPTSLPPGVYATPDVYEPPPSYEDVVRGETNAAFKYH